MREGGGGGMYDVNICRRTGRSLGGGNGKNGVRPSNRAWKNRGMPGKTHSLPSNRTTGFFLFYIILYFGFWRRSTEEKWGEKAHHPHFRADEQDLCVGGEEGHAARGILFVICEPGTVLEDRAHAGDCLCVVGERLVEGFGERGVGDIW